MYVVVIPVVNIIRVQYVQCHLCSGPMMTTQSTCIILFLQCDPPCHLGFKKRYVRCETFFDPRHLIEDQLCSQVQMKPEEESDCKADFAQSPPENRACRLTPQWKTWPWSMVRSHRVAV